MKIEKNKVVVLAYRLGVIDENGEENIIEIVENEEPMGFIFGMSGLPEGFENNIEGLVANASFDFRVNPEEGYGFLDPEAIVDLPIDMFKIEDGNIPEGMLRIGNILPMTNDEGNQLSGQVIEVDEESVTIDFNHPLANKTMHFTGTILNVRDAQPEELAHGHVHGIGGVEH